MTIAHASGKVIMFGEHAVVYGRPAIAVPVTQVQAEAVVESGNEEPSVTIVAKDLGRTYRLDEAPPNDPLRLIVLTTLEHLKVGVRHDLTITIRSTIPVACGLGSGAAVSTAIVRALARHFDKWLTARAVSDLVYEVEKIHHGTPSGIDNTVIAFEKPVYFVKDQRMDIFWVKEPFWLAIADTGIASPTREVVSDVRRVWRRQMHRYEKLFDRIGAVTEAGQQAIEHGDLAEMGRLMDENHRLLQEIEVSSPELDALVVAARQGGALGAKLSGAGRGGNVIALVTEDTSGSVSMMLRLAGARDVILTEVR